MDIKIVHMLRGKKKKRKKKYSLMIELLQKSNDTSDLQILKELVNKNNNRPMDQLQNKSWNLRTGLLKSSHFYTNYGSSPSSFARGITAFQGYCLNDFQSNVLSLLSSSANLTWNPIIKLRYFLLV